VSLALALLLLPTVGAAEGARLDLPAFSSLSARAVESVNIDIGPLLLHAAAWFLDDRDADTAQTKRLLAQVHSVRVRSYQFATDQTYPAADIDAIRKQLDRPGWNRLVQTHERDDHRDVDIYLYVADNRTQGLAVISREPRELAIVNITGSIDLDDLPRLEQQFHLPKTAPGGNDAPNDDAMPIAPR
jgi:hypothetical protein